MLALTFAALEHRDAHLLGKIEGTGKKQLLIALAGMHGNEPAGLEAVDRVLKVLQTSQKAFEGTFVALLGNIEALQLNKRFIHTDLNRIWTEERIALAQEAIDPVAQPEDVALKHLLSYINELMAEGYEEVAFIDLHTTSAQKGVFIICPDDETHIDMIGGLHVPVILNLADDLKGTAIQYFWDRGHTAFAFEGGSHQEKESANKMESALWLCLEYMGCLQRSDFDNVAYHDGRLRESTKNLPQFCRLKYHHYIKDGDAFKMKLGFKNFDPVVKGQWMATDKNGPILCPYDGFVLMPLYQEQGSDGFFIVAPV